MWEELNFLKSQPVDKDIKEEAVKVLIDNGLFDEAVEEFGPIERKKKLFYFAGNDTFYTFAAD